MYIHIYLYEPNKTRDVDSCTCFVTYIYTIRNSLTKNSTKLNF